MMSRQTEDVIVSGKEVTAAQPHMFKETAPEEEHIPGLRYTIFDPTGNITILVEDDVPVGEQPEVAARLMKRHPAAEQVGFFRTAAGAEVAGEFGPAEAAVTGKPDPTGAMATGGASTNSGLEPAGTETTSGLSPAGTAATGGAGFAGVAATDEPDSTVSQQDDAVQTQVHALLRMAGGEFCGNATMCAAALYLLRSRTDGRPHTTGLAEVRLRVSGAARPVEVRLQEISSGCYSAGVHMPASLDILTKEFTFGKIQSALPVVRMEGISHIVIESDSAFYSLLQDRVAAEEAVRLWCESLNAEGLGLMFLDTAASALTPLVFIPGSATVFWENSCASGTAAAGMFLAKKAGRRVKAAFTEPGGELRVESDPVSNETWLYGTVRS